MAVYDRYFNSELEDFDYPEEANKNRWKIFQRWVDYGEVSGSDHNNYHSNPFYYFNMVDMMARMAAH